MTDYQEKEKKSANGQYSVSEFRQLKEETKRIGKLIAGELFLQDYASFHTAQVAVDKAAKFLLYMDLFGFFS